MEELKRDFNNLLNDSPIDDANRTNSQSHIEDLVAEELSDAENGFILTDKSYLTIRIKDASIKSIKERMGRWLSARNDVMSRANEIKSLAKASGLSAKERTLVEEAEEAKSQARETYMRNNHYADLKSERDQTKDLYETMRSEMGGKPPVRRKRVFYFFSIMLIGVIEWFINYSTFNIKYPPGVAFGATVLIALAIAFASHFHGAFIKQRVALFADSRQVRDKNQVKITQFIFSFLFIIALAIVTYNRYDVLQEQLVNDGGYSLPGLPGAEETTMTIWEELLPFVFMNILVWLVGVAISYFIHDSRPDYQEALAYYEKAKKNFFAVDTGLKNEEKRIGAEFEEKIQRVKNAHKSSSDNTQVISGYIDRLKVKENGLVSQATNTINENLERHQSLLVSELRAKGMSLVSIGPEQLALDEYLKKDIMVSEADVRKFLVMEAV